MKRLFALAALLLVTAAIAASAALATERSNAFCLSGGVGYNGTIYTPYSFGEVDGHDIVLTTDLAYDFVGLYGGNFSVFFGPRAGTYHIDQGACPGKYVAPPPMVFECYSKWQVEPRAVTFAEAQNLVGPGKDWLPWAIKDGTSITDIGNGYHLRCNLGPGMKEVPSTIVGGGGEKYTGQQADGLKFTNPLDFYQVAA